MKKDQPAVSRYDIDKQHRHWGPESTRITLLYPVTPFNRRKDGKLLLFSSPFSCRAYAEKMDLSPDNARKQLEQKVFEGKLKKYRDVKGNVVYVDLGSGVVPHDPFNLVKRKIKPKPLTDRETFFLGSVSCRIGR